LEPPSRATTQATFAPAALTLVTEHRRVGSPRATTIGHRRPAFLVIWTTARLRPATIHQTLASTTHVCFEDRHDRRVQCGRGGEVVVDELGVRVDDRELGVRAATEQVAGTRSCVVQKRA
jgi:hypothetical protein